MTTPTKGASVPSASPSAEFKEIVVKRDGNRPISFAGQALAKVSMGSNLVATMTAALYRTRGGKFVAALSKERILKTILDLEDAESPRDGEFNKAQVFDNFDEAVAWFRPGRLTDALRKQLGLDEPERIE